MKSKTVTNITLVLATIFIAIANLQVVASFPDGVEPSYELIENGKIRTAIKEGDVEGVRRALNNGASASFSNEHEPHSGHLKMSRPRQTTVALYGHTTHLSAAAHKGNREIMELLLEEGADLNIGAPVVEAYREGHTEIIKWLIDNGTDINIRSFQGFALLPLAIKNKDWDFVDEIFNLKGNLNIQGRGGKTGLIIAAQEGNSTLIERFIKAKADVNLRDNDRATALEASLNHLSCFSALVIAGLNFSATENDETITHLFDYCKSSKVAIEVMNALMNPNVPKGTYGDIYSAIIMNDFEEIAGIPTASTAYWGDCAPNKKIALELAQELEREKIYEYLCGAWGVPEGGSWRDAAIDIAEWVCYFTP